MCSEESSVGGNSGEDGEGMGERMRGFQCLVGTDILICPVQVCNTAIIRALSLQISCALHRYGCARAHGQCLRGLCQER